jgi:hypothetical protein
MLRGKSLQIGRVWGLIEAGTINPLARPRNRPMTPPQVLRLFALVVPLTALLLPARLPAADARKTNDRIKEIAGSAEFLRSVPKRFATLQAVDPARHRVTLLIEGETLAKVWPLTPDAEIKVSGWWGRLDQLTAGDRVWAWFKTDRAGQPAAVFMLADELSEQEIHRSGLAVATVADGTITLKLSRGKTRTLKVGKDQLAGAGVKAGDRVYIQSAGDQARLLFSTAGLEARRAEQQAALRKRWLDQGLPGTVTFLHLSGEMDFMLDHEAMRWARSLKPGDTVSLLAVPPIAAVVKEVRPWRERTQLRLVMKGRDQADLTLGQRLGLKMTPPARQVEQSALPPDIGRRKDKKERVEWFLASIYCACGVGGNGCTGHFYTLASCNPNACGMPNAMRRRIAEQIDKGLTDKQIFEALLKKYGPDLVQPHLLP